MKKDERIMHLIGQVSALSRRGGSPDGGAPKRGYGRILAALEQRDGMSQQEIADTLCVRPQSASGAIDALEEQGFVERRQSADDRRKFTVFITEAGRRQSLALAAERAERAERLIGVLDEDEKDELLRILSKIVTADTEK